MINNESANRILVELDKIQRVQDEITKITKVSMLCFDTAYHPLTELHVTDPEGDPITQVLNTPYLQSCFESVGDDSIEDIYMDVLEDGDGGQVHLASIAIRIERKAILYILAAGVEPMGEEAFLQVVDFIRDCFGAYYEIKWDSLSAEIGDIRNLDAEQEMNQALRTLEATKGVLQLLDSNASTEQVFHQWTDIVSDYLKVDYVTIFRIAPGKTMEVLCEKPGEGLPSCFDHTAGLKMPEFLGTETPLVLSTELLQKEEYTAIRDYGPRAVMVFPLLQTAGGESNMALTIEYRTDSHAWKANEVKFAADASKVLQSIIVGRINRHSIEESIRAMEDILDNIGNAVYLVSRSTGKALFANRMLEITFSEEWRNGRLMELLEQADIEKNPQGGSFEVFYEEKEAWYDLIYRQLDWVDGSKAVMYSLYDITDRKRYQRKIEQQAFTDFLTGLYNRMCCERDLAKMIDESRRRNIRGALIYLDLDNFKHINDGMGHQYGDVLLKNLSAALREIPGLEETCYRMGGDEFVLLVDPAIFDRYEEILDAVHKLFNRPWYLKDADYYITASIGTVTFPDLGDTVVELIKKADIAMYEAKKTGKNRVARYTEGQESAAGKRLNMEKSMRDAGTRGYEEFEVYYQPIISLEQGGIKCVGAEALVRWNSEKMGFVMPSEFIPLAEYLGMINPIGNHVLREACKACKEWNDRGYPDLHVAVNLSVVQLLQNDIVDQVANALKESGLNPANLNLEVTESLAINDMERMQKILGGIKELGVFLSLDDFGTGYSSLNHIRQIPFDIIKVDQAFVKGLDKDDYAKAFIKMVAELAETLNVRVLVEGIETEVQLKALEGMKVGFIQGFYFDKPMPRKDFEQKYITAPKGKGKEAAPAKEQA